MVARIDAERHRPRRRRGGSGCRGSLGAVSGRSIVTARSADRFRELRRGVVARSEPAFLNHDRSVARYWGLLPERYPDFQFCLVDDASGQPIGVGHSVPLDFDEPWSSLPDGGLDWALELAFSGRPGTQSTVASALYILVADGFRGQGWSTRMLEAMRAVVTAEGVTHLVAPVRPSRKASYPLIPIEEYSGWVTDRQEPFDPWLRAHQRVGGRRLHPCRESMVVDAPIADWTAWTGLDLPSPGRYVIPGGHVPLIVSAEGRGHYREPGVWVLHALA